MALVLVRITTRFNRKRGLHAFRGVIDIAAGWRSSRNGPEFFRLEGKARDPA